MAKITNRHGLPEALVRAAEHDTYSKGDSRWSVTQLCDPPQLVTLHDRYEDEVTADVVDRLFALEGRALHALLEAGAPESSTLTEERLFMDVEVGDGTGVWVSGQLDAYEASSNTLFRLEGGTLRDYKWTSVAALGRSTWELQLNMLAALLRHHGHTPERLEIVALLRDWSGWKAARETDYPPCRVHVYVVEMWPPDVALSILRNRVRQLYTAAFVEDSALPPCTAEDRWVRGGQATRWAVRKSGATRAANIYDQSLAANARARELGPGYFVEVRHPEAVRCTGGPAGVPYCPVAKFCHQKLGSP